LPGSNLSAKQIRDDEPGILSFGKILRFSDYPPTARPAVQGPVGEILVDPLGLAVFVVALAYLFQLFVKTLQQSIISCQAKDIEYPIRKYSFNPSGMKLKN